MPFGAVLSMFAHLLAPFMAAALARAPQNDPEDGWVDQPCSPLGRRLHCSLARRGALPARKLGRRWLVKRTVVEAYIAEHGKAAEPTPSPDVGESDYDENAVRELLATCGQHLSGSSSQSAKKAR
ncbi:MAG: helix-turn-helix domain-containing protein [Polyangiaceae bacterium]